jgi:ABC-2 type transport system permease protein
MNLRIIQTIARKDIAVVLQNKGVWMPIAIVPIVLLAVLPGLGIVLPTRIEMPGEMLDELRTFAQNMPAGMLQQIAGLNEPQTWVVLVSVYIFAPFFLIIPLMVSMVVGADSFAGEKERKTLEALLYTPATDTELFIGKVLAALIPAVLVSWASFLVYVIVVNAAGWSVMGRLFFPTTMWVVLMLWVVPAAAAFGLSVIVLISVRAKSFQEANQLGGVVVIPILLLVFGQLGGVLYFSVPLVLLVGMILWAVDAVLAYFGIRTFQRGELIARL